MNKGANKALVIGAVAIIIVLTLLAVAPVIYKAAMNSGVQTGGISTEATSPATTDVNGQWDVVSAAEGNTTSLGYTFEEILPGERRSTSGSTRGVSGHAEVSNETVQPGAQIVADLTKLETDQQRRDVNVRHKLLETDRFPEATFTLTKPADFKGVPDDGTPGAVELTGELVVKGVTVELTETFDVVRSGANIILAGTVVFDRENYGVHTPDFIAAKIAEEGELNIRVVLAKNE